VAQKMRAVHFLRHNIYPASAAGASALPQQRALSLILVEMLSDHFFGSFVLEEVDLVALDGQV
jgi:hypothetical protein